MRKVLLAVDGSDISDEAARWVSTLPHRNHWDLTILSVVQRPLVHDDDPLLDAYDKACAKDRRDAVDHYGKIAEMFDDKSVSVCHRIESGSPNETIVETAKEIAADLVVVGAKGRSQISRMLLGSVSDHVATHAPCSVLVVRGAGRHEYQNGFRVCLAYGIDAPAKAALCEMTEIAWRSDTVFHVLSIASYLHDFFGVLPEDSQIVRQYHENLNHAHDQLLAVSSETQTHLIESEHVGEGIVTFAERNAIDMVVVGEKPRSGVSRFLLGSTSRYVLRHAECSVWIARNRLTQTEEEVSAECQPASP
ncbi:universal stress protein [Rhodopirellula maiorica SM1]|uniref:Universal stress protein n=1 Tax=Rhodopirellula maiorica SM1 TaxID=1265738 RepID=M5RCI4_9BACT|nr:universal stress protein [Rhodopirellula maiorica]EMI16771.1 universal stress protein [Rhodopirellula maiorica SM1]